MTTAALGRRAEVAEAIRELFEEVRELVSMDTDDPAVLDKLSKLLGRARRRVNKATKAAEPSAVAPPAKPTHTPAPPAAAEPASKPAAVSAAARPAPGVTVTLPSATPQRPASTGDKPATPGAAMPQPQLTVVPQASTHRRRPARRWIAGAVLLVLAVIVIILLAGCSSDTASGAPAPPPLATVTVSQAVNPNTVECSNVERAYNAWDNDPTGKGTPLRLAIERGKAFYAALEGYKDEPVLELALQVARYNVDVAQLNATYVATGQGSDEIMHRINDGMAMIRGAYASFKFETCRAK